MCDACDRPQIDFVFLGHVDGNLLIEQKLVPLAGSLQHDALALSIVQAVKDLLAESPLRP